MKSTTRRRSQSRRRGDGGHSRCCVSLPLSHRPPDSWPIGVIFGASQSGRFLRQFLHDGFNVDEEDRRAFDLVWPHIAGAGQGSFNERFAAPGYNTFSATRFPFADLPQAGPDGERDGILAAYRPDQAPKVIYTNTSVEYWGLGRSAALTHLTLDGTRDADVPRTCASTISRARSTAKPHFHRHPGKDRRSATRCRRATSCAPFFVPRISGSSRARVRRTAGTQRCAIRRWCS